MTQFSDWKQRAADAREAWATTYWAELVAPIQQWLSENEISDEAFRAAMEVCIPGPHHNPDKQVEEFSNHVGLHQNLLHQWLKGHALPPSDLRVAYLHICLTVAGSKSLVKRVEKLISNSKPLPEIFFRLVATEPQIEEPAVAEVSGHAVASSADDAQLSSAFAVVLEDHFEFSGRVNSFLMEKKIVYVGQLASLTESEILRHPNIGRVSINEIKTVLENFGVRLGMSPKDYPELAAFLTEHSQVN